MEAVSPVPVMGKGVSTLPEGFLQHLLELTCPLILHIQGQGVGQVLFEQFDRAPGRITGGPHLHPRAGEILPKPVDLVHQLPARSGGALEPLEEEKIDGHHQQQQQQLRNDPQ